MNKVMLSLSFWLQEPVPSLPNFSEYGFYGAVLSLLVAALWMLWKRLSQTQDRLLQLSNDHNAKLVAVIDKNNTVLDGLKDSIVELSTEIKIFASKQP